MKLIENLSVLHLENVLDDLNKFDIFISSGSFEERCKKSISIFLQNSVKIETSIIFSFIEKDKNDNKGKNLTKMLENLKKISKNLVLLDVGSVSKPSKGIKKFILEMDKLSVEFKNKKILLDISTFPKPYLFLLIKVLFDRYKVNSVYVCYTEPLKYKDKNTTNGETILTSGLDRIECIPGFVGNSTYSQNLLIVILGFEGNRAQEVFEIIEPTITYAINGFPSYKPGWHKISIENNMSFLNESGAHRHIYFAPANDPFETEKVISELIEEIKISNPDNNIIIAPLGTKIQALGILLYALRNRAIKIVYPFPSIYMSDRSEGVGESWIFKVDLSKWRKGNES